MSKKYKAVTKEINSRVALNQAAQALDLAGKIATEGRDTDTLLAVGKLWMDMIEASQHAYGMVDGEERPHTLIGFQPNGKEDEDECFDTGVGPDED